MSHASHNANVRDQGKAIVRTQEALMIFQLPSWLQLQLDQLYAFLESTQQRRAAWKRA